MKTRVVKLFLQRPDLTYIPLDDGLRIQVLPNISYLPECQKHHFAAFIQEPSMLVVWDDDPNHLLTRGQSIQDQMMNVVWGADHEENEKFGTAATSKATSRAPSIRGKEFSGSQDGDDESSPLEPPRRVVLIQPVITAITLILVLAAMGGGWKQIALQMMVDQKWIRLALLVVVPLQIWLALVRLRFRERGVVVPGLTWTVLLSIRRRLHRPDHRSHQPNDRQHQILLRHRSRPARPR